MAIGSVNCVCKKCGAEFTRSAKKYNRREADSWESWAAETYDLCKVCYAEQMTQKDNAKIREAGIELPELTAASERQLKYAESLRREFAVKNLDDIIDVNEVLWLPKSEIEKRCHEANANYELSWSAFLRDYEKYIAVLQETDAGKLLDVLLKKEDEK